MIAKHNQHQANLFEPSEFLAGAIESLSKSSEAERGAVFTRSEVVEFILDLVGYTPDKNLWEIRLLEPSFGLGDFLEVAVKRLLDSWKRSGSDDVMRLKHSLVGIEVHRDTFTATAHRMEGVLRAEGVNPESAASLIKSWLHEEDFLLKKFKGSFDVIVGNPPYVRQEMIPDDLLCEYRRQFASMYDRADLYIPFIEKALSLLGSGGQLGFICSDRWMKNRYGGPLRAMVSHGFHLKYYVDMVGTKAFTSEVSAYPAITVIAKESGHVTRVAHRPEVCSKSLKELAGKLQGDNGDTGGDVREIATVTSGTEPWVLEKDSLASLGLVRRLEAKFPSLEEAGCKVGIGVATGADRVFIGRWEELDVEPCRKLPLIMTGDIRDGTVKWRGFGVINPFEEDGRVVHLETYPKLKQYFEAHSTALKGRHVAKKGGSVWYRTIDKINSSLTQKPKLLIPDIKGKMHVVLEQGCLYPHHNLYFITSDTWDLKLLQGVLMSRVAQLFVDAYSTKMRGGCFRFQAQYLRRIRIPRWDDIPPVLRRTLMEATETRNASLVDKTVAEIYGLNPKELEPDLIS